MRVHYLHQYSDLIRAEVLAAKVGRDWETWTKICEEAAARTVDLSRDRIVAAPSSAWSRVRGRWDLAAGMTGSIARETNTPTAQLPYGFYFQWRKRSHALKMQLATKAITVPDAHTSILIVDDVVTTGSTMTGLAAHFLQRGFDVTCFSYALAGKYLK